MTDLFAGGGISIAMTAVPGSGRLGLPANASYFSLLNQAGLLVEPPIEEILDTCNFWDISVCTDVFKVDNKEEIEHVNA